MAAFPEALRNIWRHQVEAFGLEIRTKRPCVIVCVVGGTGGGLKDLTYPPPATQMLELILCGKVL